jgi:hypothetical protein
MQQHPKIRECLVMLDRALADHSDDLWLAYFVLEETRRGAPRFLELLETGIESEKDDAYHELRRQMRARKDSGDDFFF